LHCPDYRWCGDLKPVYKDSDGMKHCVFHAPAEHKGISSAEFNEKVLERVSTFCKKYSEVDLSGTIFPANIDFTRFGADAPILSPSFEKAVFHGDADFRNCVFDGKTTFKAAVFIGVPDFSDATFKSDTIFEEVDFKQDLHFTRAKFLDKAHFFDVHFGAWADFREVEFSKELYFSWGAFTGGGDFKDAKFGGRFIFKRKMPLKEGPDGTKVLSDEPEGGPM